MRIHSLIETDFLTSGIRTKLDFDKRAQMFPANIQSISLHFDSRPFTPQFSGVRSQQKDFREPLSYLGRYQ